MEKTLEECYGTLGLSVSASKEEVRKAYKRLALECHPDKNHNSPAANSKFQELGYAYKRITDDENLEAIDEDCSEFDYWLEVFFYCLVKEEMDHECRTREHNCCCNCAQAAKEEEVFLESLYKKHKRNQKETVFTDEEMKHFTKFSSLKEQREFNKKIFCEPKKPTSHKTEPKAQKAKMKSNKQLKAEQWKREQEISKIAEEIEIKKKQKEQKLEYAKEYLKKRKENENSGSCTKDEIDNHTEVERKRQQDLTGHREKGTTAVNTSKEKPKKKHKKGRVKAENKEIDNKKLEQEHKPYEPSVTKPSITNNFTRRPSMSTKPVTQASRSSTFVSQPLRHPSPVTLPQPPNIWLKRLESQNNIQEIQPSNEEEELRQLEIALEMSKKQVEIDQQQKQIMALQEEIQLMSLEQEQFESSSLNNQLTNPSETETTLPDSEITPETTTNMESYLDDTVNCNLDDKLSVVSPVEIERQCSDKRLEDSESDSSDSKSNEDLDDSYDINHDCCCTPEMFFCSSQSGKCSSSPEMLTGISHCGKCTSPVDKVQKDSFRPWEMPKLQTQTQGFELRKQKNSKELKPCPYGKNCCLGKKCKYFHPLIKKCGLKDKQNLCTGVKKVTSHELNTNAMDIKNMNDNGTEEDMRPLGSQDEIANESRALEISSTEDWDDEIEKTKVLDTTTLLQKTTIESQTCVTESDMFRKDQYLCTAEVKGHLCDIERKLLLDDNLDDECDKMPLSSLQFDIAGENSLSEDWDKEIEGISALDRTAVAENTWPPTDCQTYMAHNLFEKELPSVRIHPPDNNEPVTVINGCTRLRSIPCETTSNCHGEICKQEDQLFQSREMSGYSSFNQTSTECNRLSSQGYNVPHDEVRDVTNVGVVNGYCPDEMGNLNLLNGASNNSSRFNEQEFISRDDGICAENKGVADRHPLNKMTEPGVSSVESKGLNNQGFITSRNEKRCAANVAIVRGNTHQVDDVTQQELLTMTAGLGMGVSRSDSKVYPQSIDKHVSNQFKEQVTQTKVQLPPGMSNGGNNMGPVDVGSTSQMCLASDTCQESDREYQQGLLGNQLEDSRSNKSLINGTHCNGSGQQVGNVPQQGFVTPEARVLPMYVDPLNQPTVPGVCPGMTNSSQYLQWQLQANSSTKPTQGTNLVQQGSHFCLPMPNVAMPGVFPGSAVMHQAGLYNIPWMPSMFMPPLNYPLAQTSVPGVTLQTGNTLPKTFTEQNIRTSIQQEPASEGMSVNNSMSTQEVPKPETQKIISNLASSTKQVLDPTAANFPYMPSMPFGFQGNQNTNTGVTATLNGIPNMQHNPLMALPFPLIPGFMPVPQQSLISNGLINTQSSAGNTGLNNLQKSSKLVQGQINNYIAYCPPLMLPSKRSAHTANGLDPMSLMTLESNYHAILQMHLNSMQQSKLSCAEEYQTKMANVAEDVKVEAPLTALEEKCINGNIESKCMKINEETFKTSCVRKPSSVPKVLSYADRNQ